MVKLPVIKLKSNINPTIHDTIRLGERLNHRPNLIAIVFSVMLNV